jgi:hypothetical protein
MSWEEVEGGSNVKRTSVRHYMLAFHLSRLTGTVTDLARPVGPMERWQLMDEFVNACLAEVRTSYHALLIVEKLPHIMTKFLFPQISLCGWGHLH